MADSPDRGAPAPAAASDRAHSLSVALAARGLHLRVEAIDALAVLIPVESAACDWAEIRDDIVRVARAHGFTHVALEVLPCHTEASGATSVAPAG